MSLSERRINGSDTAPPVPYWMDVPAATWIFQEGDWDAVPLCFPAYDAPASWCTPFDVLIDPTKVRRCDAVGAPLPSEASNTQRALANLAGAVQSTWSPTQPARLGRDFVSVGRVDLGTWTF